MTIFSENGSRIKKRKGKSAFTTGTTSMGRTESAISTGTAVTGRTEYSFKTGTTSMGRTESAINTGEAVTNMAGYSFKNGETATNRTENDVTTGEGETRAEESEAQEMAAGRMRCELLRDVWQWTVPALTMGKRCFVSFYAFDPLTERLKRKKMYLGRCRTKQDVKDTGARIIKNLMVKLADGWNPWIESSDVAEYTKFADVCERYREFVYKAYNGGDFREQSLKSYLSYLHIFETWGSEEGMTYIYQLDRKRVAGFLDYVYIVRNNTLQTRNNYLAWLRTFSVWLLERCYLKSDPTAGLRIFKKRGDKQRRVIPDEALIRVKDFLEKENKHFLLACYLLHYCFIRPKEMALLKVGDVSVKNQTLRISGDVSKNRKTAMVTLPRHVLELMIDLGVFANANQDYLFSKNFRPGREFRSEKSFRDYWTKTVRKKLKLPATYKFYSLKDTGITSMLKAKTDILTVRDQARHSSIAITDIYTPKDMMEANEALKDYEGEL